MSTSPDHKVPVWDLFVRVFHWSLVASFATTYFSTEHIDWAHKGAGYQALALLASNLVIGVTGHLMTTDAFWGDELVETLHVTTVDITLIAVIVHVGANLYESIRHRENMFKAMVTGDKNAPDAAHQTSGDDPDSLLDGWPDTMPSEPAPLMQARRSR